MKSILLITSCLTILSAENLTLLNDNKKEIIKLQKEKIFSNYESLKNSWISPWQINSNFNQSDSTSSIKTTTKRLSLGFSQSIFESGGIEFTIKYADDKKSYDLLSLDSENLTILESIYKTILEIKKLKLQIKQSSYKLKNKEIEIILKKIQYESGTLDITDLNNAIIAKNSQFKENISLQNSLKDRIYELSKLTNFKYDEIEILDFSKISKEEFLNSNIDLKVQEAKTAMLKTEYQKMKTNYLPKLSFNGEYGYSDSENDMDVRNSGDYNSIGVTFSFPLDYNKNSTLLESKLEYLTQKVKIEDLKQELQNSFEQSMNQINTYKAYNETTKENINLYSELIEVATTTSNAGYTSKYDLDILKNTKSIDNYELQINDVNIELEFAKLYFKLQR